MKLYLVVEFFGQSYKVGGETIIYTSENYEKVLQIKAEKELEIKSNQKKAEKIY